MGFVQATNDESQHNCHVTKESTHRIDKVRKSTLRTILTFPKRPVEIFGMITINYQVVIGIWTGLTIRNRNFIQRKHIELITTEIKRNFHYVQSLILLLSFWMYCLRFSPPFGKKTRFVYNSLIYGKIPFKLCAVSIYSTICSLY